MARRPPESSGVRQCGQHARPILSRAEAGVREIHAEVRRFVRSEDALHQRTGTAFRKIHEVSRRVEGGTGGGTLDLREYRDVRLDAQCRLQVTQEETPRDRQPALEAWSRV